MPLRSRLKKKFADRARDGKIGSIGNYECVPDFEVGIHLGGHDPRHILDQRDLMLAFLALCAPK